MKRLTLGQTNLTLIEPRLPALKKHLKTATSTIRKTTIAELKAFLVKNNIPDNSVVHIGNNQNSNADAVGIILKAYGDDGNVAGICLCPKQTDD